jgi:hypothetical protein
MRITTIMAAAVSAALLAGPAFAQTKTDEEKKHDEYMRQQQDRLYRSSTANIQVKEVVVDPWNNMRGDNEQASKKKK